MLAFITIPSFLYHRAPPRVRGHGGDEPRLLEAQMVHIFYPGDFELFPQHDNS